MAQVAGIKIEKDAKGNPRYARFDLRKHGEVIEPYLSSVGAIENDDLDMSDFITGEELVKRVHKHIDETYADDSRFFTKR